MVVIMALILTVRWAGCRMIKISVLYFVYVVVVT
jgi:hypothetical protein